MPNTPKPLTATPPPHLDWSREGTPASTEYDDIYFSVDGGLDETSAVFLQGCGLPENWQSPRQGQHAYTICELGFGSGLNFLATWALWLKTAPKNGHLHFLSIEAYPWTKEDLRKALSHWPTLKPYTEPLLAAWPGQVKGLHRLHFGNVTLTLFHMHVEPALSAMDARVDAWFLDGFSPSKNPDMWSSTVFNLLAQRSAPGAGLATFTVAGAVRRGLAAAGFKVEKKPGFGRKRERLEARYQGENVTSSTAEHPDPIIIGGGIAGASIARAFLRRGITPTLIDPEPDLNSAASGNPAALIMPRLDLQDRPESRFFLSAYLYALEQYRTSGFLQQGITHIAKSDAEQLRFEKLLAQHPLPNNHMQALDHEGIQHATGLPFAATKTGLHFPTALLIDPKTIIVDWTAQCHRIANAATHIECKDGVWAVSGNDGNMIAQSRTVFLCVGANIQALWPTAVRFTRGQICWGQICEEKSETIPHAPLIYGGYAAPYDGGVLLGATHDHVDAGQNNQTKPSDTLENITQFENLTGTNIESVNWQSRASVRVTTKDTLPICTQVEDGGYIMSGLGARGFMMAPLLGEALVCRALNEPSPLCTETQIRFKPK